MDSRLAPGTKDYVEQLDMMRQNDRTTLYVDFAHIELVNQTLGEAIQTQYFRYYFVLLHISYNLPTFCIFY